MRAYARLPILCRAPRRVGYVVMLVLVAVLGGLTPRSFANSSQLDDRDRSLDWALGGLEQGSRISRPTATRAPKGAARTTSRGTASPTDAKTARTSRGTAGAVAGVRSPALGSSAQRASLSGTRTDQAPVSGTTTGGSGHSGTGTTGGGSSETSTGGGATTGASITVEGSTNLGSTGGQVDLGTQAGTGSGSGTIETGGSTHLETETSIGGLTTEPSAPTQDTSAGGETSGSGLGIHVETETNGGTLQTDVQAETPATTIEAGTSVDSGVETGADLSGQVDMEAATDTSGTQLVGAGELTGPAPIETTTATELETTLSGGGNDTTAESDADEAAIGDNADDCTVLDLVACPSLL